MNAKTLGERVKFVRKKHDMTQVNFAKSLGISQANLSEIESGKSTPSIEVLVSLVVQYKVNLHWLILSEEMLYTKEIEKDEVELISFYRQLEDIAKEEVIDYIKLKLMRYKK
ncbi:helix-turn-helix domain-containing protein [Brevibacillus sp. M2.1A]|uniref:helix-turn-helix domain-containing protein n=1 Tax=Brevibacillus sp. M2.1A TaxID=2738980 RepID=UPI00156A74B6|nr:helix-turn-helix transcriptional regulator [Brevibacillus sp. M2.1A]MCC8438572.1 helix-turn-helix domain-containing protein [Brevibacillus sp. M2.1A]